MKGKIQYDFSAEIWQHNSTGSWFFVSLPEHLSKEIRENLKWQEEGWGRMKASASIGNLIWETAIWFDRKRNTYLLPLKAEIREKEGLQTGDLIELKLWI